MLNASKLLSAVDIMAHTPDASSSAEAKDWPGPFWAMSRSRDPKGEGVGRSRSAKAAMAVQPMIMDALRGAQVG